MQITLQQVAARHPAARTGSTALRGLSLQIQAGEQVAVIGPSGAGKSTLLQVLACALSPAAGVLQLDGRHPWQLSRRQLQALRGQLFLAPQVPPLPPRQRVVTSVLAGRLPAMGLWASLRSLLYPSDIAAAHQALEPFDLADKLFERVDRLSGGERQRVALARAWLAPARLWLLDEPLSALDPARAGRVLVALQQRAREQRLTLVASLHHVDLALQHFPRIIGLRAGELCFDLPAHQVDAGRLAQLYAQAEHELLPSAPVLPWLDPEPAAPPAVMVCR